MKKLLFSLLFVVNCQAMSDVSGEALAKTDGKCGSVKSSDWNSPNDTIARLNGAYVLDKLPKIDSFCPDICPYRCNSYFIKSLIDSIKILIEDLYRDNLIDLYTMEYQLKALQTERSVEIFKEILDHIKKLKDE